MEQVTTLPVESPKADTSFAWPEPFDLFGVPVTPTDYVRATDAILEAAERDVSGLVSCHAVHAVVTFSRDAALREMIGHFDMITPDGQPVRWALNLLYGAGLRDRVYGPDLMNELCRQAAERGIPIYLYGGNREVAQRLPERLQEMHSGLQIAGSESPPFRPLTPEEDDEVVARINTSGAKLVFIGLGCPKQDQFAFQHRDRIQAVQICVGAAFDFHAGAKKSAPLWMKRRGLEWLFRLCEEPRRLWKRYLVTNTLFLWMLAGAFLSKRRSDRRGSSRRPRVARLSS